MRLLKASTVCKLRRCGCTCVCDHMRDRTGQSSAEFAIILAAFICVAIALGALWRVLDQGLFIEHALMSASHHLSSVDVGAWGDVLAY